MEFIGTWKFHSIGALNHEEKMVYMNATQYIDSPMPYIDESDSEAVEEELNERKKMTGMQVKICDDGNVYMLMPVPDNVSKKELKEFLGESGMCLVDGMLCERPMEWEIRNGELWIDTGITGEALGTEGENWVRAIDDDGYFTYFTMRFEKAE